LLGGTVVQEPVPESVPESLPESTPASVPPELDPPELDEEDEEEEEELDDELEPPELLDELVAPESSGALGGGSFWLGGGGSVGSVVVRSFSSNPRSGAALPSAQAMTPANAIVTATTPSELRDRPIPMGQRF